jgi:hypothetical protein
MVFALACWSGLPKAFAAHSSDTSGDLVISVNEMMRVIQLYNMGEYHCDSGTEDGFCPGTLLASGNVQFIPGSSFGNFEGGNVLFGLFDTGTGATRLYLQDGSSRLIVFDEGKQSQLAGGK